MVSTFEPSAARIDHDRQDFGSALRHGQPRAVSMNFGLEALAAYGGQPSIVCNPK